MQGVIELHICIKPY